MKRIISIFSIIFLVFFQAAIFNNTAKAATSDIVIESYSTSSSQISKGQSFKLTLTLKNTTTSDLSNVYVTIDDGSFYPKSTGSTIFVAASLGASGTAEASIDLVYDGGTNSKIPITIKHSTPEVEIKTFVGVNATPPDNSPPPAPSIPDDTSKYVPVLSIVGTTMPTASAGYTATVPVTIKNTGSHYAKDITITPELSDDGPFIIDSMNTSQLIDTLSVNESKTVNFRFAVSANASEKIYKIKLNFRYYNSFGNFYGGTGSSIDPQYISVRVSNGNIMPKLNIKEAIFPSDSILAGQSNDVQLKIVNSGTLPAKNIKVTLSGFKDDGFSLYNDTNVKNMSTLYANEEGTVKYSIIPSKKMDTGSYGLTVKFDYKDQSGKDYSEEHQFFMPVDNSTSSKSVPKIILKQYSPEPSIVKAGQNFKLNLVFFNTSGNKTVQNIKVFFTVPEGSSAVGSAGSEGSVFSPVNGSNTFYIDSISPKGTVNKCLEFFTIPDASPKTYTVTANFEYEDKNGNEYKSTELIGIPVSQQVRIETSEINLPPEIFMGQPVPVSLDFYNTGKVQLRNMKIRMEGDFDIQDGRYFLGNFEVGGNEHFEASVIPKSAGTVNGAVILSYDEPTGENIEIKKDFTLNVVEMPQQMPPEGMEGMNGNGMKKSSFFMKPFVWVVLIIAAAAGAVVFRTIKKKKGGMTLDE